MDNKAGNTFRDYIELSKLKIMLPVSLTGFTGYFIYNPHITGGLLFVTAGILLLAASASVINQLQEIATDRLMDRTRNRPLPSGRIKRREALILSFAAFFTGILLVLATGSLAALLTSIFTIAWYNGVYTNLKRITPYAVIPGALTGALPPLIGWFAAGGPFPDITIVLVMTLFFIGQIPHFWLFILKYGEEYEAAGLPSLTAVMERKIIIRLVFAWIVATSMAAAGLWRAGVIVNYFTISMLLAGSAALIVTFAGLLKEDAPKQSITRYSFVLDGFFLIVIVLLIADRLV